MHWADDQASTVGYGLGISICNCIPPDGGDSIRMVPPSKLTRSLIPTSP
jgi:hypothetical protein